jgi:hypothetical protein
MSKFLLTIALILSSVGLKASPALTRSEGSVSAPVMMDQLIVYGAYDSQAAADARGDYEINYNGADAYGAGYCDSDPEGGNRGPGYYVAVHYP